PPSPEPTRRRPRPREPRARDRAPYASRRSLPNSRRLLEENREPGVSPRRRLEERAVCRIELGACGIALQLEGPDDPDGSALSVLDVDRVSPDCGLLLARGRQRLGGIPLRRGDLDRVFVGIGIGKEDWPVPIRAGEGIARAHHRERRDLETPAGKGRDESATRESDGPGEIRLRTLVSLPGHGLDFSGRIELFVFLARLLLPAFLAPMVEIRAHEEGLLTHPDCLSLDLRVPFLR